MRISSKFLLSTLKNCWDRLRSLPSSEAFREFRNIHSYVLHIRSVQIKVMEISSSSRRLARSFHYADFTRACLDWLCREYYFRISIRTLNSNDHFTLILASNSLSLSLFPSFTCYLTFPLSLSPLNYGSNIFSSVFYHSAFWVSASLLYPAVLTRIHPQTNI